MSYRFTVRETVEIPSYEYRLPSSGIETVDIMVYHIYLFKLGLKSKIKMSRA